MNSGVSFFFRAFVLLMLCCAVWAELGASESHSTIRAFNSKYDVPSTLGSISVRHNVRSSDKYQTLARQRMISKRMSKTFRRSNRISKTNMKIKKIEVLGKPTIRIDNAEPSDPPRLPDRFDENQFTFTSQDSPSLVIQVKPFRRSPGTRGRRRGGLSYKVYVLEGLNIRHFRVAFQFGRLALAAFEERQRVANCIRRRYVKRCMGLPLRKRGKCTTRIVKKCVPEFIAFEEASSGTLGTLRSSPLPFLAATTDPSPEPSA